MRAFPWIPAILAATLAIPARAAEPFELKDGDRVVLIGSTLIEREQRYGYWETALTARWPDRNITFRNLGWSGDTVWGEARAAFDTPKEGYKRLVEHTLALKPTVIFIGYGTNESFAGEAGLPRFKEQLNKLLDDLAPSKARVLLLAPLPLENLGQPRPDPAPANRNIALYAAAIKDVAARRGSFFADLGRAITDRPAPLKYHPLTDNGLHLTDFGYSETASELQKALGLPGPPAHGAQRLRQAIVEKNQLYFHRWRPANETYLFGFRKQEQGQNAREIPQFDPLVEKAEKEIARLRRVASIHEDIHQ